MKRCARSLFAAVMLMVSGSGMALADGVVQFGDIRLGVQEGDVGYVNVVRSGSTVGAVSVLLNVGVGGTARFGTDFDIDCRWAWCRSPTANCRPASRSPR